MVLFNDCHQRKDLKRKDLKLKEELEEKATTLTTCLRDVADDAATEHAIVHHTCQAQALMISGSTKAAHPGSEGVVEAGGLGGPPGRLVPTFVQLLKALQKGCTQVKVYA